MRISRRARNARPSSVLLSCLSGTGTKWLDLRAKHPRRDANDPRRAEHYRILHSALCRSRRNAYLGVPSVMGSPTKHGRMGHISCSTHRAIKDEQKPFPIKPGVQNPPHLEGRVRVVGVREASRCGLGTRVPVRATRRRRFEASHARASRRPSSRCCSSPRYSICWGAGQSRSRHSCQRCPSWPKTACCRP